MFLIEFITGQQVEFDELAQRGRITLGDFSEVFISPLTFWATEAYHHQWIEAAKRLVAGYGRACFVTAMRESLIDGPVFLWSAYRSGDTVYLQHRLLLGEMVKGTFDPLNLCEQVGERTTIAEDGEQISEWQVSISDIEYFLRQKQV